MMTILLPLFDVELHLIVIIVSFNECRNIMEGVFLKLFNILQHLIVATISAVRELTSLDNTSYIFNRMNVFFPKFINNQNTYCWQHLLSLSVMIHHEFLKTILAKYFVTQNIKVESETGIHNSISDSK